MRIGGNVGGKFRGIVVDARPARQLPGHKGCAARSAKRTCRIGIGEADGLLSKRFKIGRLQEWSRAIRKQGSIDLVGHENEDVRALHDDARWLHEKDEHKDNGQPRPSAPARPAPYRSSRPTGGKPGMADVRLSPR